MRALSKQFLPSAKRLERAPPPDFERQQPMSEFDAIYTDQADFVYALCFRLEGETEKAERLFADVWRSAHDKLCQSDTEKSGRRDETTVFLCRLLAHSHRRLGRSGSGDQPGAPAERALTRLASEYRLPLVLREVAGLTYAGIAEALEIPEPTVRARLGRARTLVRLAQSGGHA